ncbi:MAG: hypothetical protein MZW92_14150 [Comamonadaceae bacterium]|nr:hypothetical protein [Comamonadaceae bacterium]
MPAVMDSYRRVAAEADLVIVEGAGTEVYLRHTDVYAPGRGRRPAGGAGADGSRTAAPSPPSSPTCCTRRRARASSVTSSTSSAATSRSTSRPARDERTHRLAAAGRGQVVRRRDTPAGQGRAGAGACANGGASGSVCHRPPPAR